MGKKQSKRRVKKRRNTKVRNTLRKGKKNKISKRKIANKREKHMGKIINGYKIIKRLNTHKSSIKYGGDKEDYPTPSTEKLVGKGSFGQVFLTKNSKDGKLYAMKKILFDETDSKSLFLNEIKILKMLEGITNVCHYKEHWQFESGEYGGTVPGGVIIMDYIDGISFDKLLYNAKTSKDVVSSLDLSIYIKQLSETLENLHALGIYHNDIKPDNIMISGKQAYLIDFGCADINEPPPKYGNPSYRGNAMDGDGGAIFYHPSDTDGIRDYQYDTYSLIIILYIFMNCKGIVSSLNGVPQHGKDLEILRLLKINTSKINITDNYIDLVEPLIVAWLTEPVRRAMTQIAHFKWSAKMLSEKIMEDIVNKLNLIAREQVIDKYKEYFKYYIEDDGIMYKYIEAGVTAAKNETALGRPKWALTSRWEEAENDPAEKLQLLNNIYIMLLHKLYIICKNLQLQTGSRAYKMMLEHESFIEELESIVGLESARPGASANKAKSLLKNNLNHDPTIDPIFIALPMCISDVSISYRKQQFYYGFLLPPRMEQGGRLSKVIYYNGNDGNDTFNTFDVRTMVYYEIDDYGDKLQTLQIDRLRIIHTKSDIPTYPIIIDVESIPETFKEKIIKQQKKYAIKYVINNKKERIVNKVNKLYRLEERVKNIVSGSSRAPKEWIVELNEDINKIVSELTYCTERSSDDYANFCEVMINAFIYNELIRDKRYPLDLLDEAKASYKEERGEDPDLVTVTELARHPAVDHEMISQAHTKVKEKLSALNIPLAA